MTKTMTFDTQAEYEEARLNAFVAMYSSNIRNILDKIASYKTYDIDERIMRAHNSNVPIDQRARAAWEVVAWNIFIDPYTHPNRAYHADLSSFISVLEKHADSLFLYAITVVAEPSRDIAKKLKTLHPDMAHRYEQYCADYDMAKYKVESFAEMARIMPLE